MIAKPSPNVIHIFGALTAGKFPKNLVDRATELTDDQMEAARSSLDWVASFRTWAVFTGVFYLGLMIPMFFIKGFIFIWMLVITIWSLTSTCIYIGFAIFAVPRSKKGLSPYPTLNYWSLAKGIIHYKSKSGM
jgi:hypothetical protein